MHGHCHRRFAPAFGAEKPHDTFANPDRTSMKNEQTALMQQNTHTGAGHEEGKRAVIHLRRGDNRDASAGFNNEIANRAPRKNCLRRRRGHALNCGGIRGRRGGGRENADLKIRRVTFALSEEPGEVQRRGKSQAVRGVTPHFPDGLTGRTISRTNDAGVIPAIANRIGDTEDKKIPKAEPAALGNVFNRAAYFQLRRTVRLLHSDLTFLAKNGVTLIGPAFP